jgi:hypothetical protein
MDLTSIPFIKAAHFRPARTKPIQLIVMHTMEAPLTPGRARAGAQDFKTTTIQKSAHFCVDRTEVIQCVKVEDTAFACINANANGINIELAAATNNVVASGHIIQAAFTPERWTESDAQDMLDLAADLAATLCAAHNIPAQAAQFGGESDPTVVAPGFCEHRDVPLHGDHTDCGDAFPFDDFLARVQSRLDALGRGEAVGGVDAPGSGVAGAG